MKTKLLLIPLLMVGVLLAGCETAANLNKIKIGMTKDEVISLLGAPDSMSAQANVEYLTYYLYVDEYAGGYRGESGYDKPYMVRLVDGKVESFGRFTQLFDLYSRPVTSAKPGQPNFPIAGYNPYVPTETSPYGQQVVVTPAPVVQGAPAATDIATQLQKLKQLKDQGVLTDEEFQKAKEKILAEQK